MTVLWKVIAKEERLKFFNVTNDITLNWCYILNVTIKITLNKKWRK